MELKSLLNIYLNKLKQLHSVWILRNKVRNLLLNTEHKKFSAIRKRQIKLFFKKYGYKSVCVSWHEYYWNLNGSYQEQYIPEDLYFTYIEPGLNRSIYYPSFLDKNILDKLFPKINQPATIIKNTNGFYFNEKSEMIDFNEVLILLMTHNEFVVKPTLNTGGGRGVKFYKMESENKVAKAKALKKIILKYEKNFIFQKRVKQNQQIRSLNKSSLNTIRIMTYMNESKVHVLSSVLRIGRNGEFTDNSSAGGISCGIMSDGNLMKTGFDSNGNKYYRSDNGLVFEGFKLPQFKELKKFACELHPCLPFFKLVSWDLSIDENDECVLVEFNAFSQEINFHQLNNGPLFGGLTNQILAEVKNSN